MAGTTHYLSGKCKWARLITPDTKYNKYTIDVQLDDEQLKLYRSFKLKGPVKEGNYVTLPRKAADGRPEVVNPEGAPVTDLIGNDSEVTCKIEVYNYDNKHGKGSGTRLMAVMVNNLVKYEKPVEGSADAAVGGQPPLSTPPASTPRKRIPF